MFIIYVSGIKLTKWNFLSADDEDDQEIEVRQSPSFSFKPHQNEATPADVKVELCSKDLWRKFHSLGTEMIITKAGR